MPDEVGDDGLVALQKYVNTKVDEETNNINRLTYVKLVIMEGPIQAVAYQRVSLCVNADPMVQALAPGQSILITGDGSGVNVESNIISVELVSANDSPISKAILVVELRGAGIFDTVLIPSDQGPFWRRKVWTDTPLDHFPSPEFILGPREPPRIVVADSIPAHQPHDRILVITEADSALNADPDWFSGDITLLKRELSLLKQEAATLKGPFWGECAARAQYVFQATQTGDPQKLQRLQVLEPLEVLNADAEVVRYFLDHAATKVAWPHHRPVTACNFHVIIIAAAGVEEAVIYSAVARSPMLRKLIILHSPDGRRFG